MAVDAPMDVRHIGFAELRRTFDDALGRESDHDVLELAETLGEIVAEAIGTADLGRVSEARGTVTRLLGRASRRQDEETAQAAINALRPLAAALAHSRTILATRERNERRRRGRGTVRQQVLAALLGGDEHRPRDLAAQLDVSPAQLVRVLAELEHEGRAVKTTGRGEDRRATFYSIRPA
jgi:hypothetical protein